MYGYLLLIQARVVEHDHAPVLYVVLVPLWRAVALLPKIGPVVSVWSVGWYVTKSSVVHSRIHADVVGYIFFMNFLASLLIGFSTFLKFHSSVLRSVL